MVSTDIPRGEVDRFVELALKARSQKIATLSLVPPMINTAHPDIALVQQKVAEAIARAEGRKPATDTAEAAPDAERPAPTPTGSEAPATEDRAGTGGRPPRRRPRRRRRPRSPAARSARCPRVMRPTSRRTSARFAEGQLRPAPRVYAVTTGPLPRIVAVVVTFNRLGAAARRSSTRLGEIDGLAEVLVIDNASSDGTGEWLAARAHTGEIPLALPRRCPPTAAAPAASTTAWPGPSTARPTWSG